LAVLIACIVSKFERFEQPRGNLLTTTGAQIGNVPWGHTKFRVNVVANILTVMQAENVRLDPDKLGELYTQLGETAAEDVVCRAIEELAVRLTHCERLWRQNNMADLRKNARSLIAIADQIGMSAMAMIARDVTHAVDNEDVAAIASILFRLLRVGERSLTAVWDQQDLTV
jgi:hypothetical protein